MFHSKYNFDIDLHFIFFSSKNLVKYRMIYLYEWNKISIASPETFTFHTSLALKHGVFPLLKKLLPLAYPAWTLTFCCFEILVEWECNRERAGREKRGANVEERLA